MVSLAILACAWVYVIEPVLLRRQTPLDIRLVLTCYPTASVFLVVVTLRIAFGPDQRRSPSYWFLLCAMSAMFIGDSLYMLTEIHLLHLPNGLLDVPYELAYLAGGLAALHPSMRSLTEHTGRGEHTERSGRIVIVIVALLVPALLLLNPYRAPFGDRIVLFGIILALTFTAVARMAQALHEAERSESKLLAQAMRDSLTGLPNRRSMRVQLTEVLEQRRGRQHGRRRPLPRPRPVQGSQRHARPHARGRADQPGGTAPQRKRPGRRPGNPARRR